MSEQPSQSFSSHAQYVPGYHYVATALLLVNLIWTGYRLAAERSMDRAVGFVVAIALVFLMYYARAFALKVQDRVIRLEERIRLKSLCAPSMHADIDRLTPGQLVAIRFASDAEVPELAAKVIGQGIADKKQIKSMIKTWRPDYFRA